MHKTVLDLLPAFGNYLRKAWREEGIYFVDIEKLRGISSCGFAAQASGLRAAVSCRNFKSRKICSLAGQS
jgi:hypothetical protein